VNETNPIRSNPIWRWRWPLAALVVAAPILVYAVACSLPWVGTTFPGFFLMNNGVVPTVSGFDWPPDRNAIFHAEILELDGARVDASSEVYRRVAAMPVGTYFEYGFRRDEKRFSARLASRVFAWSDFLQTYGVMLVFGTAWLVFGITVGFLQPERSAARVFLFQSLVAGLYPVTGIFLYQGDLEWLTRLYFLLECVFPATWLHLAVVFPIEQSNRTWKIAVPVCAYSFSLVLAALVYRGLGSEPVVLAPLHVTYIFSGACMLAFACHLAVQFVRHHDSSTRARVKAVLPGTLAAAAIASFAITNSALATRDFPRARLSAAARPGSGRRWSPSAASTSGRAPTPAPPASPRTIARAWENVTFPRANASSRPAAAAAPRPPARAAAAASTACPPRLPVAGAATPSVGPVPTTMIARLLDTASTAAATPRER